MLKFLRKRKIAKNIFYLLAIIIVPAFIFWGSASVIKDRYAKGYAGKIFGKKISYDEYMNALHAWRNQLRIKFGDRANQIENLFDLNQVVWDRLILQFEAKKRKIKVNDGELTKYITSLPFLQKDGVFVPELYELFLRYSLDTSVRIFEEGIRETLKLQKLFDQVTEDVQISEKDLMDKYRLENEQIKVRYACILFKDLEKEVKLNEEEIKEYYQKQKQDFLIPIQINLSYIGIDYPKEATETQREDIDRKIKKIKEFIDSNKELLKVENEFGLQIKETGFFSLGDPLPGFDWLPQNYVELFNLTEKQFTNISQTPKGPYIFQLKEKRLDYLPGFEEVKEKIKEKFIKEKAKELTKNKIEGYYSQIKTKKESEPKLSLEKIAQQLSLPTKESAFFTIISPPPEIGSFEKFIETTSNLGEGEISQVIELKQGYFVIEVSERKPIEEEEFQKERENLKQTLVEEKKNQAFEGFFTKLRKRANLIDYIPIQKIKNPS